MSASPSILALLALLPLAAADNGVEFQFGDPPPDGVLCNPALAGSDCPTSGACAANALAVCWSHSPDPMSASYCAEQTYPGTFSAPENSCVDGTPLPPHTACYTCQAGDSCIEGQVVAQRYCRASYEPPSSPSLPPAPASPPPSLSPSPSPPPPPAGEVFEPGNPPLDGVVCRKDVGAADCPGSGACTANPQCWNHESPGPNGESYCVERVEVAGSCDDGGPRAPYISCTEDGLSERYCRESFAALPRGRPRT